MRRTLYCGPFFLAAMTLVMALTMPVRLCKAANLYWDGTGTSWNTASFWSTSASATTPNPAAKPGSADIADFNIAAVNTAQTVNLDAAQSALGLVFGSTGTVLIQTGSGTNTLAVGLSGITVNAGAGADTISSAVSLAAGESWTNNSSNLLTVSGTVSAGAFSVGGSGNITLSGSVNSVNNVLTKTGSGTLTLSGATDNNSLAVTVNSGAVVLAKTSSGSPNDVHAIGQDPLTVSGGTAQLGGTGGDQIYDLGSVAVTSGAFDTNARNETFSTLNLQGTGIGGAGALVNTAAGASTITPTSGTTLNANTTIGVTQSSGSLTLNNVVSGNFALTKVGAGTLILTGTNTFTGGVTINAGTIQVGSAGSHTGSSGTLIVGSGGPGALNVLSGGQVDAVSNYIGLNSGAAGTATIDGAGSTWTNNGGMFVGEGGSGTLNITGGGQLVSLNNGTELATSDIADEAGSTGTVTVAGAGSKFSGFLMSVGDRGNGTLNVLSGGQASVGSTTIANAAGSKGTVNIDGSGSKYTATADPFNISQIVMDVGESGTGTLNITNGGQLTSIGTRSIGRFSTGIGWVNVDGSGSSWVNSAGLVIGNAGSGILNITGSSLVSNTTAVIGSSSSSNGAVTVDGVGSHWTNSSFLDVGAGGVGTLTILNGGQVSNTTGSIGGTATALGFVTVDGLGSIWTNSSNVTVGNNGTATLTVRNGATVSVGGLLTVGTSGTVRGNSTISGNVQNGGVVAPGSLSTVETSLAALLINGNFAQTSAGILQIQIGGTTASTQYDQLIVSGSANLDGTLQVSLVNGFMPVGGNQFDILDWGTRSGNFSSVSLPALSGSLAWDTSQLYTTGILSIGLPGDYNGNGVVDAADYVVWRNGLGTTYVQSDYDVWRAHFGQTAGGGAGALANSAVPEPATLVLLMCAAAGWCLRRGRAA